MSLFHSRRRARHAAVRTEAQLDLRDGLLEARADRIAELEALNARLAAELATYKTVDFMRQALRLRRRQAERSEIRPVDPARQRAAETEVHPRALQRRNPST